MASGGKGDPFRERLILALLVTLLTLLSLAACQPPPSSALSPTASPIPQDWITFQNQSTETVFIETVSIPLENCNGNRPATSETTRERSTTTTIQLGVSGGLEAGIPEVVKVTLAAEFNVSEGETRSASQNVRVEVDPGAQVTYELTWYETWQIGDVVIDNLNLTIPYRVRTGVQSELRSGTLQACPTTITLSPANPTDTPTLTLTTPAPTDTATVEPTDTETPTPTNILIVNSFDDNRNTEEAGTANTRLSDTRIEFPEGHMTISNCPRDCGWWTYLDQQYRYSDYACLVFEAYTSDPGEDVTVQIDFKVGNRLIDHPTVEIQPGTWSTYIVPYSLTDALNRPIPNNIDTIAFLVISNASRSSIHIDNIRLEGCPEQNQ